ncbi:MULTISPECIES: hypothetical protein [Rhizobium]|uniref:hypothetical protein n=1 Tax=Rhizobium TaxID=379 RepID=UPI001B31D611|nr:MULTISPECIES: hypothetical protein [Rhizobium]MBX4911046.1 hypothetical protein [Rhizobium bangladeshense]MBX5177197.1 hypothetical protein [Rhizobium lentis]MBX5254010.1 hypothetical protein [Rhizobium sp. NLR4b]MBX5260163.1 hypothetical protein [Rhizobium sp. NLR16b]MBX5266253.1 hypothetical protein [Rhizobium sp. NLR16a]
MNDPLDDLLEEHPAVTAAAAWAQGERAADWKTVARCGDAVVHGMLKLNVPRRHAIRSNLLTAAGRAAPAALQSDDETAPTVLAAGLVQDIRNVFEAAGKLSPAVHAFLANLTADADGVAAFRAWGQGIGFSGAEITWLLKEVAKLDHEPINVINVAGGLELLLAHAHTGADHSRMGFLKVDGPQIPPEVQELVHAFARRSVTPSIFLLLPAVAGLTWLAGTTEGAAPENEVHVATLETMIGAKKDRARHRIGPSRLPEAKP